MAIYYRWRRRQVTYTENTSTISNGSNIWNPGRSIYLANSKPSIVNGRYLVSSALGPYSPWGEGGVFIKASQYFMASSSPTEIYKLSVGSNIWMQYNTSPIVAPCDTTKYSVRQQISSNSTYVYSVNSSRYPNNGISGNYYYDQFTTFNESSQLTVPSIAMQGQNIKINWTSLPIATSYTLQRQSSSDTSWIQVYSGTALSFTEVVGDWTQVQYRVQTIYSGGADDWVTSTVVPISEPLNLIISGEDENLGIITANIPYTISSNASSLISLTRKVNQVEVANINIDSGFAYNIPIFDLPTGTNTIELIAQVQDTAGTTNATRTWTYTKTPMQFPNTGGVAQLVQNGQNIWPLTLAEAVRVPTYLGGSLDKALELLSTTTEFNVIAVGEYTGTGTYGQSNPNTLTFNSAPSMVLVYGDNEILIVSSPNTEGIAYIQGNQAKWYSTISAEDQMNSNGITYNYIAVGKSS